MEFFWNYSFIHYRWNDLDRYDFEQNLTKGKGGGFLYEIESGYEMVKIPRGNWNNETMLVCFKIWE